MAIGVVRSGDEAHWLVDLWSSSERSLAAPALGRECHLKRGAGGRQPHVWTRDASGESDHRRML